MTDSPSASRSGYWPCVFDHAIVRRRPRDRDAFRDLVSDRHGMVARREAARQDPHLLVVLPRRLDVGERAGADQEVVAVRQELDAQEAGVRVVRQQADRARLHVDLVGVAEALLHERDPRPVGRPRGALAEVRELGDVRRQVIFRVARLRRRLRRDRGHCEHQDEDECAAAWRPPHGLYRRAVHGRRIMNAPSTLPRIDV